MNGSARRERHPRLKMGLVALLFAGPLLAAFWLYYGAESLQPTGRTNHGALLTPIVNVTADSASDAWRDAARDHWVLLYANDGECGDACRDALYTIRQARLMLGKDMNRLRRVFLHGASPPDRVFLEQEHEGLVTVRDRALDRRLAEIRPPDLAAGGFYLVDPLGNLVMYFPPGIVPGDMVDDIGHLLDLSAIG